MRLAVLPWLLAGALNAHAAGLGSIHVSSRLGQPLHAEVDVATNPGERLEASCFRLERPRIQEGDIPWLARGQLALKAGVSGDRLVVTSPLVVRDPILQLAIRIGCGVEVTREYSLLLSPEESARSQTLVVLPAPARGGAHGSIESPPGAGESPASMARALYPHSRRRQRQFIEALIAANPGLELTAEAPIPPGATLTMPDMRKVAAAPRVPPPPATPALDKPWVEPRPGVRGKAAKPAADRLMISGGPDLSALADDELRLRLSPDLAASAAAVSDSRRDILRLEYRVIARINEQANTQLEVAEKLRALEQTMDDLRRYSDALAGRPALASAAAAKAAEMAAAPSAQSVAVAHAETSALPAAQPKPAKHDAAWIDWVLYAGLAASVLGIGSFLVARRRRELAARSESLSGLDTLGVEAETTGEAEDVFRVAPPLKDDTLPLPTAAAAKVPAPAPAAADLGFTEASDSEVCEDHTVVELAEIMLAFGRVKGAAEVLYEYVDSNPQEALQPWIKLLDVYRAGGMRKEFEEVAERLHKEFNVQVLGWEERQEPPPPILPGQPNLLATTLEAYPHLTENIVRHWGTAEGLAYLRHLLRDNRDGERTGFTREVAEEIALLGDVLENKLKNNQTT